MVRHFPSAPITLLPTTRRSRISGSAFRESLWRNFVAMMTHSPSIRATGGDHLPFMVATASAIAASWACPIAFRVSSSPRAKSVSRPPLVGSPHETRTDRLCFGSFPLTHPRGIGAGPQAACTDLPPPGCPHQPNPKRELPVMAGPTHSLTKRQVS
jgi:hypothetical protein